MYDLTLSQAVDLITAIGTKRTVLVEGHMGSGKTSMLKMLAKKFPDHVPVYFDCTTKDLMDLGAPKVVRHEETGHEYLTMVPNEELGLHFDKPIILLFDEIGKKRSSRLIKNRAMPLVVGFKSFMSIPVEQAIDGAGAGSAVEAHITNTLLKKTARQKAITRISRLEFVGVLRAVERMNMFRLTR
jgi:energy-coupling factor transporter ATP-binding protein EcfA2